MTPGNSSLQMYSLSQFQREVSPKQAERRHCRDHPTTAHLSCPPWGGSRPWLCDWPCALLKPQRAGDAGWKPALALRLAVRPVETTEGRRRWVVTGLVV